MTGLHHVCTECPIPHVDDCTTCFGYGVYTGVGGVDVPVLAAEAAARSRDDARPCPECGGTMKGIGLP